MDKIQVLSTLNFGDVDSESDSNLEQKFIKTNDFDTLLNEKNILTLGAKGSGKSALFEMLTRYEKTSRKLSGKKLDNVIIVKGTGLKDLKELTTSDIESLMLKDGFDFQKVWELYIAIKVAFKLGDEGYRSGEHLIEFLKKSGKIPDYRILPIIRSLWGLIAGPSAKSIPIKFKDVEIMIGDNSREIDVQDILEEINNLLIEEDKVVWILFDKIDELFSDRPETRKKALEGLFRTYLALKPRYPQIKFKIFLRTDLWTTLSFVNKSHLADKILEIRWDAPQLLELMVKRACVNTEIKRYICNKLQMKEEDIIKNKNYENIFYSLFDKQVYKGKKEAKVLDWMTERVKDGQGGMYPREMITFGNISKNKQLEKCIISGDCLISGSSIKEAYYIVSKIKCETYLSEFPHLEKHFERFQGKDSAKFTRKELSSLLKGLNPSKDEAIKELYEAGILLPKGNIANASSFEIPRLFRSGLGLTLRGRP